MIFFKKSLITTKQVNNHFEYAILDKNINYKPLEEYSKFESQILDNSMNFWDKLLGINPRHRSNNKCKLYFYSADIMLIVCVIDTFINKNITLLTQTLAPFIGFFIGIGSKLYNKVKNYDERCIV